MELQETRIRQELKNLVASSTEETREEAKILLEHHWRVFAIRVKVFMLYPLLKLLARAGKTRYEVMKIPERDLEVRYDDDFEGPLSTLDIYQDSLTAQVYERVRRNGYRPIIVKVRKDDDDWGRYPEIYWAIVIDWS